MRDTGPPASAEENAAHRALARLVFFTFLLTFISARILVILIMSRRLPDFSCIAYFPSRRALRQQHWLQAATAIAAFVIFLAILSDSFNYVSQKFDPSMEQIESQGPE